jgi:hypothetical protein
MADISSAKEKDMGNHRPDGKGFVAFYPESSLFLASRFAPDGGIPPLPFAAALFIFVLRTGR